MLYEVMHLSLIADYTFSKWNDVSLFACSLGAYFSLNTYEDRKFSKCLFQSPLLNMEYMIRKMFQWYDVSEERLRLEKEIPTPFDTLRWDYFQYVLEHPIKNWIIPTSILYRITSYNVCYTKLLRILFLLVIIMSFVFRVRPFVKSFVLH